MSILATVAGQGRGLNANYCQKLMEFYDTIADANIGSLQSLHILIDKYTFGPHAGEI